MRILVDALAARTGGGLTYLRALLPHAAAVDPQLELVVAVARPGMLGGAEAGRVVEIVAADSLPRRLLWEQTRLSALARDVDADVIFSPSEIAPLNATVPVVLGFQNPNLFQPTLEQDVRQYVRLRALLAAARISAHRARVLVFVSDAFRRLAEPKLPRTAAPRRTVTVGIDRAFSPGSSAGRFEALRPYLLSVSDVYRYKSLPVAVDAFAALARQQPELRLLLAGRPLNAAESTRLDERIRVHGLRERVVRLGHVPFEEMPDLYRGADCFVFPSILESLGLPPLEALACGAPVVAARASVMPDLLGGAAAFFPPGDAAAAAAAVARVSAGERPDAAAVAAVLERHDPAAAGRALVDVFVEAGGS